jgi:DNA-binding transcriptional LysR family regulator
MPIGLHHLRYFLAVAEEGHVTRAAARLHLAQPSLSAQIRYLEEQVGVALFKRSPRGMILTPAGEAFAAQARASLAAASAAIEDARQAAVGTAGKLKVGFIVGTQIEVTSCILQTFRERFPNVTLQLAEHSFADPSAGLNTGDVDLAFVMPPIQHDGLCFEPLFEAPRVAVLPSSHPLARQDRPISVAELFDEPWIIADTDDAVCRDYWLAMEHRTSPPKLGYRTRSLDKFIQLAAAGQVVGLAASWVEQAFSRPGITFVPVHDAAPAVTALAWHPEHEQPLVECFLGIAREIREREPSP